MGSAKKWYSFTEKVINYGYKVSHTDDENRNRRLTNSIILLTLLAHIVILAVHIVQGLYEHLFIISVSLLSFILLFPIARYWSVKYAKYHIVFGTAFLPLIMAFYAPIGAGVFLGFSYAQIYILVLILVLFDMVSHEIDLFVLITFSLLYTIFFDEVLLILAPETVDVVFLYEEYVFFKIPLLAVWSLILIIFIYRDIDINKNAMQIQYLNDQLKREKEVVETMNKQLRTDMEKRTLKLMEHQNKIEKYSYRNAHDVKGPLARIRGLNYLLKNAHSDVNEMTNIIQMLDKATNELHDSITSIDLEMVEEVNALVAINSHRQKAQSPTLSE